MATTRVEKINSVRRAIRQQHQNLTRVQAPTLLGLVKADLLLQASDPDVGHKHRLNELLAMTGHSNTQQ